MDFSTIYFIFIQIHEFMERTMGVLAPVVIIAGVFILNAYLPARRVTGYIAKPGSTEKMRYRIRSMHPRPASACCIRTES